MTPACSGGDTLRKEKGSDPREIVWEPSVNAAPHGEFKRREKEH